MAGRAKGQKKEVHVSTAALITQLSSLTRDPTGPSPSHHWLYVSCHCLPLLSSPGQGAAPQKAQSVIKTRGHWGPAGARESRLCPLRDDPAMMSATSCNPVERHREGEKAGERPLLVGTSFEEWWHFLCVVPDRPRLNSFSGVGQGVRRQWKSPVPDGTWKDCQCRVHNEDGQTTALSGMTSL